MRSNDSGLVATRENVRDPVVGDGNVQRPRKRLHVMPNDGVVDRRLQGQYVQPHRSGVNPDFVIPQRPYTPELPGSETRSYWV